MHSILSSFTDYWPFAQSVIQRRLRYKLSFFMRILGGLLQVLIMYYLWMAIYNNSTTGTMYGFTRTDMVTYVVISYIASKIINVGVEWTIAGEIRDGSIAINLIRPLSYLKRLLFESFGEVTLQVVTVVIPLWCIFASIKVFVLKETLPSIPTLLLFLLSLVLGYTTLFLFNFIFGLSAFYVTYIWGFMILKNTIFRFLSGEIIPLVFFPAIIGDILKYLPFSSLNYTPVMIYMGKYTGEALWFSLGVQAVWIIILYIIVKILWSRAIKRLTILGG